MLQNSKNPTQIGKFYKLKLYTQIYPFTHSRRRKKGSKACDADQPHFPSSGQSPHPWGLENVEMPPQVKQPTTQQPRITREAVSPCLLVMEPRVSIFGVFKYLKVLKPPLRTHACLFHESTLPFIQQQSHSLSVSCNFYACLIPPLFLRCAYGPLDFVLQSWCGDVIFQTQMRTQ